MSEELQLWIRLIQGIVSMILVLMALFITIGLWLENKRLYLALGMAALFALVPLTLLRIVAVPEPPLLPQGFITAANLIVNALWPMLGLAWLVALLHDRQRTNRLRRKYGLDKPEMENGA